MKTSWILAALAVASTASAFSCPSPSDVEEACNSVDVSPLVCDQEYIDKYAVCQWCRGGSTTFYEHATNMLSLLQRCGQASLTNPLGGGSSGGDHPASQHKLAIRADGDAPGGPNGPNGPNASPEPVMSEDQDVSGGSIAGIVLGLLAMTGLAAGLGWCWRKKRHEHVSPYYHHHPHHHHAYGNDIETGPGGVGVGRGGGPSHSVVTEKLEPVVVRTGHNPGASTSHTATGSNTQLPLPTQPNQPYSVQPRAGEGVTAPTNNVNNTTTTAAPIAH